MSFERFEDITHDDLRSLLGVAPERKHREYKRDLPRRDDRAELIADITAFANTDGGDIFFGISEDSESHLPIAVDGVPGADAEVCITFIENLLRDSVRPRLPRRYLQMRTIDLSPDAVVLAARIGASHLRPHQICRIIDSTRETPMGSMFLMQQSSAI